MRRSKRRWILCGVLLFALCMGSCRKETENRGESSETRSEGDPPATVSEPAPDLLSYPTNNPDISPAMLEKSLISAGNQARLARLLDKAEQGKDIVIGTFGGSITEGMSAGPNRNYSALLLQWFRETYPNARFKLVNAGIGATGSLIGVHRMEQNLLREKPDLIVMEFAVNDGMSLLEQETYTSALVRALSSEKSPAVMLLFMVNQDGQSSKGAQIPIGFRYGVPMVGYGDAVMQGIREGKLKWTDVAADSVHPNDRGHRLAADLLIHRLQAAKATLGSLSREIPEIPETDARFLNAKLLDNRTLKVDSLDGFTPKSGLYYHPVLANGWEASSVGSSLTFTTTSTVVTLVFKRLVTTPGAAVKVYVNDQEAVIQSDFAGGFGEYADAFTVLDRHETQPVTIRLEVIESPGIPADARFLLLAVLEA